MLRTGEQRKVRLHERLPGQRRSWGALLGGEMRESEFNDDRLGRWLQDLGSGETAEDPTAS